MALRPASLPPSISKSRTSNPILRKIAPGGDVQDLRNLPWSSIDNDTSRDLDQIEVAERVPGGIRYGSRGIADVDSYVPQVRPSISTPPAKTTRVYTGIHTFPDAAEKLSTGLTSLNEDAATVSR